MTKYLIHGGNPLHGTIQISGAKNAAVAIIPAALLVDGVCRIENVPQISDGFTNLSLDLIYGLPIQTVPCWWMEYAALKMFLRSAM